MPVQHYLRMIENASVAQRCHAAAALAHIFLHSELEHDERYATEAVLTLLLDDPSPKVRLALADAFSTSVRAPAHIVASLARDQIEISTYLLGRSVLLSDSDLIDCVASGCGEAQRVIAGRSRVSPTVCAAIVEVGETDAVLELLANTQAKIMPVSYRRLVERLGHVAEVRALLVDHEDLPADCRHSLAIKTAEALCQMDIVQALMGGRRAERITHDACVKASIGLVAVTPIEEYPALVEHLQLRGDITTAFIVRVVATGKIDFLAAILVALSGYKHSRVRSLLIDGRPHVLGALFSAAGLAESTHMPLCTAIQAWRDIANGKRKSGLHDVVRGMIEQISTTNASAEVIPVPANDDMLSLLNGIHRDAIRENARRTMPLIAAA